jgi:hypothetical protein
MKTRTKIYILGFILLAGVLLFIFRPKPSQKPPYLIVDRKTWEVKNPKNSAADLTKYNTPEAREQRRKAVLVFESPEEYRKQFPPTVEQQAQEAAARRSITNITNPPTLDAVLSAKTPEEQKAFKKSLDQMLNPRVEAPAK